MVLPTNCLEDLTKRGADKILFIQDPSLKNFLPKPYANAIAKLAQEEKPDIIVAATTTTGRTIMPLVAYKLQTGLTADCTELTIDEETQILLQTRPAIGGNIMATIKTPNTRPQMATVRPKAARPALPDCKRTGEVDVKKFETNLFATPEKFLEFIKDTTQGMNIEDADIVVAGGKGCKNQEGFTLIEELAKVLGAGVGATRDAVDLGWTTYSHQIGLSGKTVAPSLYFAIGISGTIQHLAGMKCFAEALRLVSPIYCMEDIVVSVSEIPKVVEELQLIGAKYGVQIPSAGHAGDGNIHCTLLKGNMSDEEWHDKKEVILDEIYDMVYKLGGNLSGEHGIGAKRKNALAKYSTPEQIGVFVAIKKALDPNNILNPGKVIDVD